MILLDANLLLYAHRDSFAEHKAAKSWLDRTLNAGERVGFSWPTLTAFVRLVTNPRVFTRPDSIAEAWSAARAWLSVPGTWIPHTTDTHRELFEALLTTPGLHANDVPDVHLAALAMEHGLVLYTVDAGFARFNGLRWTNPLADAGAGLRKGKRPGRS